MRAELLRRKAEALCRLGRGDEALGPASESAELLDRLSQSADAALARYWLAFAHYQQDNPAEARAILQGLLAAERAGTIVAPDFKFRLLAALGNVEAWDGQSERALAYMEEARALTDDLTLHQRAAFLSGMALQFRRVGDLERSIRVGQESLALYQAADAEREEAALEINMALTFIQLGNLDRASGHLGRAREIADRYSDTRLDSDVAEAEAQLAFIEGDEEHAVERANAAIDRGLQGGSYLAAVGAHVTLARIARGKEDRQVAAAEYESAVKLLTEHRAAVRRRDVLAEWGDLLAESGDHAGANKLYGAALGRGSGISTQR
jgi:tetratricopeptide (TPR) repeat protein